MIPRTVPVAFLSPWRDSVRTVPRNRSRYLSRVPFLPSDGATDSDSLPTGATVATISTRRRVRARHDSTSRRRSRVRYHTADNLPTGSRPPRFNAACAASVRRGVIRFGQSAAPLAPPLQGHLMLLETMPPTGLKRARIRTGTGKGSLLCRRRAHLWRRFRQGDRFGNRQPSDSLPPFRRVRAKRATTTRRGVPAVRTSSRPPRFPHRSCGVPVAVA